MVIGRGVHYPILTMTHIPHTVFTNILSYCNDPLTLYKNIHREQWRRIRVQRVRHLAQEANPAYESDEDESDDEAGDICLADVMTPYVDRSPCNCAKVALELCFFAEEFDWLNNNEDWPTVFYNAKYDVDKMHRYEYEVDYRGDLTYKELCKQEYDAYMWHTFVDEDPLFFVRVWMGEL